jgi:hypothetical protein
MQLPDWNIMALRCRLDLCRLICVVCTLLAASPLDIDAGDNIEQPEEPQYLMPVNPGSRRYEESIQRVLGDRWGGGTMIYDDDAGGDFVISAWGKDEGPKTLTFMKIVQTENFGAAAKKEISVPITDDFADAIYAAWRAMLLKTRFPPRIFPHADGWTAEFSVWISGPGGVYGTAMPIKGFAKELMDFGFELKDYCAAPEAKRKAKRDSMIPRLKDFTARVEHSRLY